MGKLIYKILFHIQSFITKSVVDSRVKIWYRNSLLQNYFSFGKSDIDVTVLLPDDRDLFQKAEVISAHMMYLPLVKEINFYYPFSTAHASSFFNTYELKKDSLLATLISSDEQFPEEQKIVYLLRMFFSNLNQSKFTSRDVKKWIFHFNLTSKNLPSDFSENYSRKELLRAILSGQKNEIITALIYVMEGFQNKTPLYDLLINCHEKDILYSFMPHQFCFIEPGIEISDEKIFMAQMSWEIMGVLNQPLQFKKESPARAHLHNLQKTFASIRLKNTEAEIKRKTLLTILESFLSFQDQDRL